MLKEYKISKEIKKYVEEQNGEQFLNRLKELRICLENKSFYKTSLWVLLGNQYQFNKDSSQEAHSIDIENKTYTISIVYKYVEDDKILIKSFDIEENWKKFSSIDQIKKDLAREYGEWYLVHHSELPEFEEFENSPCLEVYDSGKLWTPQIYEEVHYYGNHSSDCSCEIHYSCTDEEFIQEYNNQCGLD